MQLCSTLHAKLRFGRINGGACSQAVGRALIKSNSILCRKCDNLWIASLILCQCPRRPTKTRQALVFNSLWVGRYYRYPNVYTQAPKQHPVIIICPLKKCVYLCEKCACMCIFRLSVTAFILASYNNLKFKAASRLAHDCLQASMQF